MTIAANVAKQRLHAGELAVGFSVLHWRTVDIARIAKTCGFDWLLIGSNDLAAEMGIPGQLGHEKIAAAFERTVAAAAGNGKFAGMGGIYDQELTRAYVDLGVRFVLGGGDLGLMMAAARNRADFLRSIPLETK
jgi:2-keto-3-deoxy-L-rhamnonate aldolase RhmA